MAHRALTDRGCQRGATTARWALGLPRVGARRLRGGHSRVDRCGRIRGSQRGARPALAAVLGPCRDRPARREPDRASVRCREAFHRVEAVGERPMLVPFLVTGVRADLAAGRPASAVTWLDDCAVHLTSGSEPLPVADVAIAHGRGFAGTLERGDRCGADTCWMRPLAGWESHGRVWEANWARLDLAASLIRAGRFADGARAAAEVRSTASRLDSAPLAARAEAVLRMARGHTSMDQPWHPLTAREFEVARLISEGCTNAEIAGLWASPPRRRRPTSSTSSPSSERRGERRSRPGRVRSPGSSTAPSSPGSRGRWDRGPGGGAPPAVARVTTGGRRAATTTITPRSDRPRRGPRAVLDGPSASPPGGSAHGHDRPDVRPPAQGRQALHLRLGRRPGGGQRRDA